MNKQALTDIPLSPEEKYEASKLIGRSLFSAMQLARIQDERRNRMFKLPGVENEKTLTIPIPAQLMPHQAIAEQSKVASEYTNDLSAGVLGGSALGSSLARAQATGGLLGLAGAGIISGDPGYTGRLKYDERIESPLDDRVEHTWSLEEGDGVSAHVKRNLGKYLGLAGGGLAIRTLPGMLKYLAPIAGVSMGHALDKKLREEAVAKAFNHPQNRKDMIYDVLLRREMRNKEASDSLNGIMADALGGIKESPVRMFIGGNAGFRDARKEYYFQEKAKIQQEIAAAQKEYIDTLSKIKTGEEKASPTPLVDAFCNGMAHYTMFGKTAAAEEDLDISDGSARRFLGEAIKQIYQKTPVIKPGVNMAARGLLNTAAGTAYLTFLARRKMREDSDKYLKQHTPTRIELQPY